MEQALQANLVERKDIIQFLVNSRKRNLVNEEMIAVKKKKHGLEICWQYYRKKMT